MRMNVKTTTALLALLAAMACAAGTSMSALADTGGAAASSGTTSSPPAKVRPSGIATWFGPGFYGKQTACGQTLTPGVVGVANRTLPCGTLVKRHLRGPQPDRAGARPRPVQPPARTGI